MIKNIPLSQIQEDHGTSMAMHPKKFALWLFIGSSVMMFAALTSAYIVRQAEGDWHDFQMPSIFAINTVIVILSSVFMHWAYISARKNNLDYVKLGIVLTTIFGIAFLVAQFYAWGKLVELGVYFVGNPSGSFMYVLTGFHGFHIISGLFFLLIVLYSTFKFKVHSKNLAQIEMCMTYWHFLGGLWVYLYLFLLFNN
jgi:cytochrome c oxidase subunit III